ncbi:MAG: putative PEP-binding protein, partial [Erythrobacter cryptus]
EVKGLNDFEHHPPVAPVFWSFRVMVGIGVLMLAVSWLGVWQLKRRGEPARWLLRALVDRTAEAVFAETGTRVDYLVGTMIELPRAALMAGEIAEEGEFFSFGTNDLTQTTLGVSRDDAGRFLSVYVDKGIFPRDPFVSLDVEGVGQLVELAAARGRKTRPDIKLGICGEHGGDPASIAFCERVGLDYVSASPYRV